MAVLSADLQDVGFQFPYIPPDSSDPSEESPTGLFAEVALGASNTERLLLPVFLDQPEEIVTAFLATLSEAEKLEAGRLRRPLDRRNYVVAHGRLREFLGERLEIKPEKVCLGLNRYGKPGLAGNQAASGWHFNISYCRGKDNNLALCALSRQDPIGVDVEQLRPLRHAESVARHFFSPQEYEVPMGLPADRRMLAFFLCWTRKEAFIKALGRGLSCDLTAFDVSLDPDMPARILRIRGVPAGGCGWRLDSIGPVGNRVAAVVLRQRED